MILLRRLLQHNHVTLHGSITNYKICNCRWINKKCDEVFGKKSLQSSYLRMMLRIKMEDSEEKTEFVLIKFFLLPNCGESSRVYIKIVKSNLAMWFWLQQDTLRQFHNGSRSSDPLMNFQHRILLPGDINNICWCYSSSWKGSLDFKTSPLW